MWKIGGGIQGDCIEWTGGVNSKGYGPHREKWIEEHGPIPFGLEVCHECDNRRCINTNHMFLGTRSDNMTDMAMKGRGNTTKLTPDQVREIRSRYVRYSYRRSNRRELEMEYGMAPGSLKAVLSGKTWKRVA